jgi:hypothetical protein
MSNGETAARHRRATFSQGPKAAAASDPFLNQNGMNLL